MRKEFDEWKTTKKTGSLHMSKEDIEHLKHLLTVTLNKIVNKPIIVKEMQKKKKILSPSKFLNRDGGSMTYELIFLDHENRGRDRPHTILLNNHLKRLQKENIMLKKIRPYQATHHRTEPTKSG